MIITLTAEQAKRCLTEETPLQIPCTSCVEINITDVPYFDINAFLANLDEPLYSRSQCGTPPKDDLLHFKTSLPGNNGTFATLDIRFLKKEKEKCGQWHITYRLAPHSEIADCNIAGFTQFMPVAIPACVNFYVRFICPLATQYIENLLVIDLGNTRTCALLCEDVRNVRHGSAMKITRLPLYSYYLRRTEDDGVYDSLASFSVCPGTSFVRIGSEAIDTLRLNKPDVPGDFFLSSPKRYYWDNDINANGWKVETAPIWHENAPAIPLSSSLPAAQNLASQLNIQDANKLPRSGMLAGFLMELIEQAENYLNQESPPSVFALPKFISHICITYPTGWSEEERQCYQKALARALELHRQVDWCARRAMPMPKLDISCDEGSAVLWCYVYGEIVKYGGLADTWLQSIGRMAADSPNKAEARIAVIDIGGGTSDLTIANVRNVCERNGIDLRLEKLYKDGSNCAGDLLLHEITSKILVPKIARAILAPTAPRQTRESFEKKFVARLNAEYHNSGIRRLTRTFWFPLAINFIAAIRSGASEFAVPNGKGSRGKSAMGQYTTLYDFFNDHSEWTGGNLALDNDLQYLPLAKEDGVLLRKIIASIFRPTAKLFGAAICAFDVDLVIVGGKTAEIDSVRSIFRQYCHLPEDRFIPMWNYPIGDWCSIADAGYLTDSKYATALGALIYSVTNNNFPLGMMQANMQTENAPGLNEGNCLWGLANNGNFFAEDAILKPGLHECWLDFTGRPELIARRRFATNGSEYAVSYELRIRPMDKQMQLWEEQCQKQRPIMQSLFNFFIEPDIDPQTLLVYKKGDKEFMTAPLPLQVGHETPNDVSSPIIVKNVDGYYADGTRCHTEDFLVKTTPQYHEPACLAKVRLVLDTDFDSHGKLRLAEVMGNYSDGAPVAIEQLELRLRTSTNELFWLDSGKI